MTQAPSLWGQYSYVMLAGAALVVLTYLLLARLVIDVVFGDRGDNLLLVVLRRVTNPLVRAVGTITPRVVPGPLVTLCALVWVFALRIALVQVMAAMAMRRLFG